MKNTNTESSGSLIHRLQERFDFPESELKKLSVCIRRQNITRGEHFLNAGDIPDKIAYVCTGLFRYSYTDSGGSEYTKSFFPEGDFVVSYSAMVSGTPSWFSIEALEDSVIDVFDYTNWQLLFDGHPCWAALLIAMLQKGYMKKEKRERELLMLDAAERYQSFLTEYPGLETRVRQHMIASYLGITPVALSRIRSQSKKFTPLT